MPANHYDWRYHALTQYKDFRERVQKKINHILIQLNQSVEAKKIFSFEKEWIGYFLLF